LRFKRLNCRGDCISDAQGNGQVADFSVHTAVFFWHSVPESFLSPDTEMLYRSDSTIGHSSGKSNMAAHIETLISDMGFG
jgi:hypothetical protein